MSAGDGDVETRARIRLTGEIDVGTPWFTARFAAVEIRRDDATWRTRFEAPLWEIRKLASVGAPYAGLLASVADQPDDANATLGLVAPPALGADLSREEAAAGSPQEWLKREPFAALFIALDRWEPESVGIVTSES